MAFPVDVGTKPESITKGFNSNYYVTIMNGEKEGDGTLVEISNEGVKVFAEVFDEPKDIIFLNDHLYFSDLNHVWKVHKEGHVTIFVNKDDFPEAVLYLNDAAVDEKGQGMYVVDMRDTKFMRDENNSLWPFESDEAKFVSALQDFVFVIFRKKNFKTNTSKVI